MSAMCSKPPSSSASMATAPMGRGCATSPNISAWLKTDPIDARVLALYATSGQDLHPYEPPSPEVTQLKEIKARRDQLQGALIAETNRLGRAVHATVRRSLQHSIAALRKALAAMEAEVARLIKTHAGLAEKARLMRSLKGIGPITTATLIAELPELGSLPKGRIARLTGLAPLNQDSGQTRGGRHIEAGRAGIRRCLYMAAVVAMQCNPPIKAFAARLKARGKPALVVITAVMRKMIIIREAALWRKRQGLLSNQIHFSISSYSAEYVEGLVKRLPMKKDKLFTFVVSTKETRS